MDQVTNTPPATPATPEPAAVARGVVSVLGDGRISLHPTHTDYEIHLRCETNLPDGKRARGVVEARALRIHAAHGGGRFIEPVAGEPRIVAGTVRAVDAANRRVLVETAIPIWLTAKEGQDFGVIAEGGLVNCHVESGAVFRPVTTTDGD